MDTRYDIFVMDIKAKNEASFSFKKAKNAALFSAIKTLKKDGVIFVSRDQIIRRTL